MVYQGALIQSWIKIIAFTLSMTILVNNCPTKDHGWLMYGRNSAIQLMLKALTPSALRSLGQECSIVRFDGEPQWKRGPPLV